MKSAMKRQAIIAIATASRQQSGDRTFLFLKYQQEIQKTLKKLQFVIIFHLNLSDKKQHPSFQIFRF